MTNFEKAVEIAANSVRRDVKMFGVDIEHVDGWNDLLDIFGYDGEDMKDDVYHELCHAANAGDLERFPMDDCSIEDSDGSVKTYRQLANAIRKALF